MESSENLEWRSSNTTAWWNSFIVILLAAFVYQRDALPKQHARCAQFYDDLFC
jgi:hypothetical protein